MFLVVRRKFMFCEKCGTKNLKNAKFCEKCGHKIIKDNKKEISESVGNQGVLNI